MGLWIWLIFNIVMGIYKSLEFLTSQPTRAGPLAESSKFPEETFYMLGFISGMLGMLIHNNTDVSMRFVSSGTPFWLLVGLNTSLILYSPLSDKNTAPRQPLSLPPLSSLSPLRLQMLKIARILAATATILVALRILRQFDWCQMRDSYRNENEWPHFVVSWAIFLTTWGASTYAFLTLSLKATKIKSAAVLALATPALVWFWGFFLGDLNHNRAIFFSKQGIWSKGGEFDSKVTQFSPEYQTFYRGQGGGVIDEDSPLGRGVKFLFPETFWRQKGIGGAIEHYYEVHRLSPFFIMSHYFRGNVYNDWGSGYAGKTLEAFNRSDVAQGDIYRKKTDELWNKSIAAYADTLRLAPNYVQTHHQVGMVYQKWGDFLVNLAPQAERYGYSELGAQYREEARKHWEQALKYFKLYQMIDPVFDQNYYRLAQTYITLGRLKEAEETYLANMLAEECRKPYHQLALTGGFVDEIWGHENNRYDLASPRHTHDRVLVAKPEGWMILGDFYLQLMKDLPKAEEAYKKAVACTPDEIFKSGSQPQGPNLYFAFPEHITFLKRLANIYALQNKSLLAIETWQRIQNLKPDDPDLQKVFQQPKKI